MMQPHRHPLRDRLRLGGSTRNAASIRSVGACSSGSSTTSPRRIASLVMPSPARLSAQRSPACPRSVGRFCACDGANPRSRPDGLIVDAVANLDRSGQHRAGDDGADASQRERRGRRQGGSGPSAGRPPPACAAAKAGRAARRCLGRVTTETGRRSAPARPVSAERLRDLGRDRRRALGSKQDRPWSARRCRGRRRADR